MFSNPGEFAYKNYKVTFQSVTQEPHLLYYLAKAVKIGSFEVLVRLDSSWENIKIHFLLLADRTKQVKNRVFWVIFS